jgi:rfaE bifunctional protein kinase chain/domain
MKILVIGDAILDSYQYGLVNRQSPEDSTIPVVDLVREELSLGGCLNVALNIKSLQHYKDETFVSSIYSRYTANILDKNKIMYDEVTLDSAKNKPHDREIIKTRIVNSETLHQLVRIDNKLKFSANDLQRYKQKCFFINMEQFDLVVVSDYDKGIIDKEIINKISTLKCPVFVDTKKPDLSIWKNVPNLFMKINTQEYSKSVRGSSESIKNLIITQGQNGSVYLQNGKVIYSNKTTVVQNPNTIGCGDVFLAGLAVRYSETQNIEDSIIYANKAATKSCSKYGTCTIKRGEIVL